jgi:N-acetylneuraminic acid mutarotase
MCKSIVLSFLLLGAWGIQPSRAQTAGLWTWVSGSSSPNATGAFGTKGVSAPTNMPGNRFDPSGGLCINGFLWIFGGGNNSGNYLNDLWTYSPATGVWTWVGGLNTPNSTGVYGTMGVAAPGNMPGARYGQSGWTDHAGNIWIFGGFGYDAAGNVGYLNDLWMFNLVTMQWTWMSGSSTVNNYGTYGTQNTPAAGNTPGSRFYTGGWVDAAGNFWIFGGLGFAASPSSGHLNDLWEYNSSTNLWTWVSGSNIANQPGSYGTQNVASATNMPSARYAQNGVADASGNFWIFGGRDNTGLKDDLWKFNLSSGQWTWVSGTTSTNIYGFAASPGVASTTYYPGSRVTNIWLDNSGNLWIFGGGGYAGSGSSGDMNDLWEYNPSAGTWAWMNGSQVTNPAGSYGTMGTATLSNQPPGRQVSASWVDGTGNLWVMGGSASSGVLNDLWEYTPLSVLSVKELTLQAVSKGNENVLTWQSVGEINTAGFVVERSTNGIDFSDIGHAAAMGTGNNSYSFVDANPPAQAGVQYRIEAEDQQGAVNYSNVVGIMASAHGAPIVFPNPATTGVTLEMGDASLLNTPARLFDVNGRVVGQQLITGQQQYIDLQQLAAGAYFLQLTNGTTIKVIKNIAR